VSSLSTGFGTSGEGTKWLDAGTFAV